LTDLRWFSKRSKRSFIRDGFDTSVKISKKLTPGFGKFSYYLIAAVNYLDF
jgi:hypothetical protein